MENVYYAAITCLPNLEYLNINYLSIIDNSLNFMPSIKSLECRENLLIHDDCLSNLIQTSPNLIFLDVTWCSRVTNDLIHVAIKETKFRTNNLILKILIKGTSIALSNLKNLSPFLEVIEEKKE